MYTPRLPQLYFVQLRVYVPVDDDHVGPGVVVVVDERVTPADVRQVARRGARLERDVAEVAGVVLIERVVFLGEVGHEEAEAARVVVVAERDAHAALLGAVFADGDAERERLLLESAVLLGDVEEMGGGVVRDVEIGPAVVVEVEPRDAQAEVAARIGHAGLLRHVGELAVAVVVEEEIAFPLQAARPALHRDAAVFAGLVLAELREVGEIDLHVAADEKIETAVAVLVDDAAAPRATAHAQ